MYHGPIRKKLRYENYDYSCDGYYFVTICTEKRKHYFGKIENGNMILNVYGRIAHEEILQTEKIRPGITIDEFIIMPNHIHAIIVICREGLQSFPTSTGVFDSSGAINLRGNNLSSIIRGIKSSITHKIHQSFPHSTFAWQKSFYDTILRDEQQLINTREYIANNPNGWEKDEYFC